MKKIFILPAISMLLVILASGCGSADNKTNTSTDTALTTSTVVTTTSQVNPTKGNPQSTSALDYLTDRVVNASIIVLGTITAQRYEDQINIQGETKGKMTWVIYTLSVERMIKGDPQTKEVFIKEMMGIAEGVANYFSISDRVLLNLRFKDGDIYYDSPYAVFWIKGSMARTANKLEDVIEDIISIMKANNIPVAPSSSE